VTTDSEEDDYEPSPPRAETKSKRRATPKVKTHVEREEGASTPVERKPLPTRARDRNQFGGSKRPRDEALSPDEPEEKVDVVVPDAESSTNATTSSTLPDAAKEESTTVTLPPFKKKRLPPIKKNKPGTVPSTSGTSNQSAAAKPVPKPPDTKGGTSYAQEDTMDPLSGLKRPKRVNNQQEVNLNDKSVYESLFKHVRLRHEPRVLKFHVIPSLVAPSHVQVSTRKRRRSDGESWTECERKIAPDAQRMQ